MGDDPDPSTEESSDDATTTPTDETTTEDPVAEAPDSDEAVDGDDADSADSGANADDADAAGDVDAEGDTDDVDAEGDEGDVDAEGDADDEDDVDDEGDEGDADDVDAEGDEGDADDVDDEGDEGDADNVEDDTFEEQLERARENNPPLDREEVSDSDSELEADPYDIEDDSDESGSESEGDTGDSADDDLFDGPESDEEMPLAVHIEEMMLRLGVVFLFAGVATAIAFPYASDMINYLWSYHIPQPMENRPRLYGPLELVLTRLKVAGISGVIIGLPVFVYESYLFMRPGLYRTERRYYLAAVPTSLVLGATGMVFAHFLVLPAIFSYFTSYTTGAAVIAFGLAETFNLIVILITFMAIVFQIPLFIMLAIMMGLVTREWLQDKRLVFWGTFFGIAFIFSPDPTGMAPIIITLTMITLYEGTLALLRWTGN